MLGKLAFIVFIAMGADDVKCHRADFDVYLKTCINAVLKAKRDAAGGSFQITDSEYHRIESKCVSDYDKEKWTCE